MLDRLIYTVTYISFIVVSKLLEMLTIRFNVFEITHNMSTVHVITRVSSEVVWAWLYSIFTIIHKLDKALSAKISSKAWLCNKDRNNILLKIIIKQYPIRSVFKWHFSVKKTEHLFVEYLSQIKKGPECVWRPLAKH